MDLSAFYEAPCAMFLDACKKDDLLEIANHYGIVLLKDKMKMFVLLKLFEKGVFQKEPAAEPSATVRSESASVPVGQAGGALVSTAERVVDASVGAGAGKAEGFGPRQ